jgi:hypothetical protein
MTGPYTKVWNGPAVFETHFWTFQRGTLHSGLIPGGKRPGRFIPANGAGPLRKGTRLGAWGEPTGLEQANTMPDAAISNKDDTNRALLPFIITKFN